jgi:hypothetical protein
MRECEHFLQKVYMYGYPPFKKSKKFQILFDYPNQMLVNERCSKNLDPMSPLVQVLSKIRSKIAERYAVSNTRRWHVELVEPSLVKGTDPRDETLYRSQSLHGTTITLRMSDFYFMGPRAFVMKLPTVVGYNRTPHITIAYLSYDADTDVRNQLCRLTHEIIDSLPT